jgi:hypothetical protein
MNCSSIEREENNDARAEHELLGMVVGGAVAALASMGEDGVDRASEFVGGVIAGLLAARAPDALEPATSPSHRALAHSVPAAFWSTKSAVDICRSGSQLVGMLREAANTAKRRAASSETLLDAGFWGALWAALRFLAGAVPGAIAGYSSHLLADQMSGKKGLPLIGLPRGRG